eukprot:2321140-Amphidinium_carterae.1
MNFYSDMSKTTAFVDVYPDMCRCISRPRENDLNKSRTRQFHDGDTRGYGSGMCAGSCAPTRPPGSSPTYLTQSSQRPAHMDFTWLRLSVLIVLLA